MLDCLLLIPGHIEIVVVDGGSSDRTLQILERRGVPLLQTVMGRGVQMHAGALVSKGAILWFLHADTHPPPDAVRHLLRALENPGVVGGNFALLFDGGSRAARLLSWMYPHFRKLGLAYGDSGIFIRREAYQAMGGFQAFPIFEDLDLIRRLKRRGRFVHLACPVVTSSRRFEDRNFAWTFVRWMALQILFWMGVPPDVLGRWYAPIRSHKP